MLRRAGKKIRRAPLQMQERTRKFAYHINNSVGSEHIKEASGRLVQQLCKLLETERATRDSAYHKSARALHERCCSPGSLRRSPVVCASLPSISHTPSLRNLVHHEIPTSDARSATLIAKGAKHLQVGCGPGRTGPRGELNTTMSYWSVIVSVMYHDPRDQRLWLQHRGESKYSMRRL